MSVDESKEFHRFQIEKLVDTGIDFIFASTIPSVAEAIGMAQAVSEFTLPYSISFVVDISGNVLDGTPLDQAILKIDAAANKLPEGYFVNCVHPDIFLKGLNKDSINKEVLKKRLIGFQGNTSRRDPREFDSLTELEVQDASEFAEATLRLSSEFQIHLLGGCCGTTPEHIRSIGKLVESAI